MIKQKITSLLLVIVMMTLFILQSTPASINNQLLEKNQNNQNNTLSKLSVEKKVAQLFFVGITMQTPKEQIKAFLQKIPVGGIMLYGRNFPHIDDVAHLTKWLQDITPYPLFIAIDQEGGRVNRLKKGVQIHPSARKIGQINSPYMAYLTGKQIGQDCKRAGVNINFAPVLDVNINPKNKVIHNRSYSESKNIVSKMGLSFMEGLKKSGIISTVKHFPGHGNVDKDSHKTMPTATQGLRTLNKVDLAPFQSAINHGVPIIMTAHVKYPTLDKTHVATLSHKILTQLLRQDMGFNGLIITDDLSMGSINENKKSDPYIQAFEAGADLLLSIESFDKISRSYTKVLNKIKKNDVLLLQLNESITRIWTLKKHMRDLQKNN